MGTETIKTARLTLRRFCAEDAAAMYRNWASSKDVTRFLTWPAHKNIDVTKAVLADWERQYADENYYNWAIVPDDVGEPIGSIGMAAADSDTRQISIGYCIGKKYWHQGITSEALKAVIDFLFQNTNCNRIESRHDVRNFYSGMVMKKCGMQYEGTLREAARGNNGLADCKYYAILRKDYEAKAETRQIEFEETEKDDVIAVFAGKLRGKTVGCGRIAHYDGRVPELCGIWLTDEGKELLEITAFAEGFFSFLKERGYEALYLIDEDMDSGDRFGFTLESRDASGWYPKYEFSRRLV